MNRFICAVFIVLTPAATAFADDLIFASATAGAPGQSSGGGLIGSLQYIGVKFELTAPTQVSRIGGQFSCPLGCDGQIFGAIMAVDSLTSLPQGTPFPPGDPFSAHDLSRIKATVLVNIDSTISQDYEFPLSVLLPPGTYALIYGNGQFGAGKTGAVSEADGDMSLSAHTMVWNNAAWTNGGFPKARFTVYGQVVPEPSLSQLLVFAGISVAMCFSRTRGN